MNCWDSDMPEDVARAYAIWDSVAAGNISETARLLEMRRPTVQEWSQRYGWKERQANLRTEDRDRTISHAWAKMVATVSKSVQTIELAIDSRIGPDGKPPPGTPTTVAVRAAFNNLAMFGVTVQRHAVLTVQQTPTVQVTDAELDALIASGNTTALLTLAAGHPLPSLNGNADHTTPPVPHSLPPDFTSGQTGGRAGSEPSSGLTFDAEFHDAEMNGVADGGLDTETELGADYEG